MKTIFAAAAVALCVALPAQAERIYALTSADQIISFDSATPGILNSAQFVTGLQPAETLLGIDYRPANGLLYGLGSSSRLYLINPTTGAATQVGSGQFSTLLSGTTFGFDFNPTVDRIRVVSDLDQNLRLNPNDGSVAAVDLSLNYAAGDPFFGLSPNINAAAYANNVPGALSTTLYVIDSAQNSLAIQNPPNNGTLTTVGLLTIDASRFNGFDISGLTGIGYAATPAASGGPAADLYTINLATGGAALVGHIGGAPDDFIIKGLSVVAVPEPGVGVLALVGGLGLWMLRLRRRS
jgi:hypothetical protein